MPRRYINEILKRIPPEGVKDILRMAEIVIKARMDFQGREKQDIDVDIALTFWCPLPGTPKPKEFMRGVENLRSKYRGIYENVALQEELIKCIREPLLRIQDVDELAEYRLEELFLVEGTATAGA